MDSRIRNECGQKTVESRYLAPGSTNWMTEVLKSLLSCRSVSHFSHFLRKNFKYCINVGSSFLNMKIFCLSLSFLTVNEESLGFRTKSGDGPIISLIVEHFYINKCFLNKFLMQLCGSVSLLWSLCHNTTMSQ